MHGLEPSSHQLVHWEQILPAGWAAWGSAGFFIMWQNPRRSRENICGASGERVSQRAEKPHKCQSKPVFAQMTCYAFAGHFLWARPSADVLESTLTLW